MNCVFAKEAKNPFAYVQGGFERALLDDVFTVTVVMCASAANLPNSIDINVTFIV